MRELVERQVAAKRGLSGAAIKTGFAVIQKVRPAFVEDAITVLLPEFADALEPFYPASTSNGTSGGQNLVAGWSGKKNEIADALLGVTDRRIASANGGVQKVYRRLRGNASEHVSEAVPELAALLDQHV